MTAALNIGWFLWLVFSILCIDWAAHIRAMIRMFPEGWKWWATPMYHVALAQFAVVVLLNPITGVMQ